jgi:hypothetical protein
VSIAVTLVHQPGCGLAHLQQCQVGEWSSWAPHVLDSEYMAVTLQHDHQLLQCPQYRFRLIWNFADIAVLILEILEESMLEEIARRRLRVQYFEDTSSMDVPDPLEQ